MKQLLLALACCWCAYACAQAPDAWDSTAIYTANNATWLNAAEREMIAEINRIRTNPKAYAELIKPQLREAQQRLRREGKGAKHHSTTTTWTNGKSKKRKVYHYRNEEEVKALKSLVDDLENLEPLNALLPSKGIHKACTVHATDQIPTGDICHRGTDGSWPFTRIPMYAPDMKSGNENIVGGSNNVRRLVQQLLIDDGIPGYGHRYNIINPDWTHVSCLEIGDIDTDDYNMSWWLQNFGQLDTDSVEAH